MRCPYCGGLNQERAAYCVNCGRDLTRNVQPQQHPYQPNQQAQQGYPPTPQQRPVSQPQQVQAPAQTGRRQSVPASPPPRPVVPPPVAPAPEAPAPFPPHTMEQLNALLPTGVQQYTVVETSLGDGKKKLVRIAYPRCVGWQQAATLIQAFKEAHEEQFDTIVIQGILPQQKDVYGFTNGQLQFDRNVRLGSQIGNRYVIETGDGFASDSTRFVLSE